MSYHHNLPYHRVRVITKASLSSNDRKTYFSQKNSNMPNTSINHTWTQIFPSTQTGRLSLTWWRSKSENNYITCRRKYLEKVDNFIKLYNWIWNIIPWTEELNIWRQIDKVKPLHYNSINQKVHKCRRSSKSKFN